MRGCKGARHPLRTQTSKKAQSTLEFALLLPVLFTMFVGSIQILVYIQSSVATQYAAFISARSFQVHGDRTLGDIGYRKVASSPKTNNQQTIAEAAAEMVIFESLMWEQSRIDVRSSVDRLDRVYEDGNDMVYSGFQSQSSGGAVKVSLHCSNQNGCENGQGVTVSYCAPIVFPGARLLYAQAKREYPCTVSRAGRSYDGLMMSKTILMGREPMEP